MRKSILIDPEEMKCAVCGKQRELQWHHVIHGTANRVISDRYGLTVWLCQSCHEKLHGAGNEYWRDVDNQLKVAAQRKFEDFYGHDMWMGLFHKNYFDD